MAKTLKLKNGRRLRASVILLIYILIKFVFARQLDSLGDYASYIFELLFILSVGFYFRQKIHFKFKMTKIYGLALPVSFLFGFVVYRGVGFLGLPIPFDLSANETVLFLLLIGPLIEEAVFRMSLWLALDDIIPQYPNSLVVITALLFAFGHFIAYFFVPTDLQTFILYQTAYTLIIGVWWGLVRLRKNTIASTVPLHILFNLGFYIAFLRA